jgi:hypothetical protein
MDIGNVLTLIGSLIVFLLGLFLVMLKGLKSDLIRIEGEVLSKASTQDMKDLENEIKERVLRPDCVREMDKLIKEFKDVKDEFRDVEKDVTALIRGKL